MQKPLYMYRWAFPFQYLSFILLEFETVNEKNLVPPVSSLGDLAEFVRLLTEHQALMRGYIRTLIPNASDIKDVLQNTNIVLWERREDFKIGTNFRSWAFTVARYRALEHRKIIKRDHRLVFDEKLIDLLGNDEYKWDVAQLEEKHLALDHCLGKLNPKDRALVHARYSRAITLDHYSKSDGRSSGSLRVALNRIRGQLRLCIVKQLATTGYPK